MAADKFLSADHLFALVRAGFEQVPDQRADNAKISLPDALMPGFAMFSLKDPSLLAFDERRKIDSNLRSIYGIENAPGDTEFMLVKLWDILPNGCSTAFYSIGSLRKKHPDWFHQDLTKLFNLLAQSKIKPVIAERMRLDEAARAHELIEQAAVQGKIVLMVNES